MSRKNDNTEFLKKLEAFSARLDAVTEEMNNPDMAGNATRMVKLAKEHANLKRLVDPYREYRRLGGLIEEAFEAGVLFESWHILRDGRRCGSCPVKDLAVGAGLGRCRS